MVVFKYILICIILFFVWNILKRLFYGLFYGTAFPPEKQNEKVKKSSKTQKKGIHWDAENIDYEETNSK